MTDKPPKIELIKMFLRGDVKYMIMDGDELGYGGRPLHSITIWWEEDE